MSSSAPDQPLKVEAYKVGWITALPIELAAAAEMLDEEHPPLASVKGDPTLYTLGHIGPHNVVIACLPGGQMGISAATAVATRMLTKFTSVRFGFMVGIGHGVPNDSVDIRLGDVVVSLPHLDHGGVVQYDFGKEEAGEAFRRTGHLNTPPKLLLNAVNQARANYERGRSTYDTHLAIFENRPKLQKFSRVKTGSDHLFMSTYAHAGGPTCVKCQTNMLVEREPRDNDELVQVHYGTIASGNRVIKDPTIRDNIVLALGGSILCFEMEAAGLMNDFPCLVVRGICDYSDSHKQDKWQRYAAATAAAYTKELLSLIPAIDVATLSPVRTPFLVPFVRNTNFTGRKRVLDQLTEYLRQPHPVQYVAIYGLGGCGKSAVVLELAYRAQAEQPPRAVFWVPAIDRGRFEQAYREIAILYEIPGAEDQKTDILDLVRRKLGDATTGNWLLIVDNADDPDVLFSKPDHDSSGRSLWDYLPNSRNGLIVFTTRSRKVATDLASHHIIPVEEFESNEAQELFQSSIPNQKLLEDERLIATLLKKLTYLPLAIVQAVAFINKNDTSVGDYLRLFDGTDDEMTAALSRDFRDHHRYSDTENSVGKAWYISFRQIQEKDPLAAECLFFIACIASTNIPKTFLLPDEREIDRTEAIGTLIGYRFLNPQQTHALFDLHPLVHLATRNWLKHENQWTTLVSSTIGQLTDLFPDGIEERYDDYRRYVPHGIEVLRLIDNVHNSASIDLLEKIGHLQHDLGEYDNSLISFSTVFDWRKEYLESKEDMTLYALSNMGLAKLRRGEYSEAENIFHGTVKLKTEVLGPTDPSTLDDMGYLADVYGLQGRYKEAEELYLQLLDLKKQIYGKSIVVQC